MSAPPSRDRPTPLHQRSPSQNNALAIRVVPYSPPRLQDDESPGQPSSAYAVDDLSGDFGEGDFGDDDDSSGENPNWTHEGGPSARGDKERWSPRLGLALSAASDSTLRLVRSGDERVSGSQLATNTTGPPAHGPGRGPDQPQDSPSSPSSDTALPRPLSRRRNFVAVHEDKTFSLVRQRPHSASWSLISPTLPSFSSEATSSHDLPSIGASSDGHAPSSPLTATSTVLPDNNTPSPSLPLQFPLQFLSEDPAASSPWNYRIVGGLRKVPKTPDLKRGKAPASHSSSTSASENTLTPLPEISPENVGATFSRSLVPAHSFSSSGDSLSTTSETTNYKVYGQSPGLPSSDSLDQPSSNNSNVELLGTSSSPAGPSDDSLLGSPDSDANYVLHGEPSVSPSPAFSSPAFSTRAFSPEPTPSPAAARPPTYSQESLVVPPLRPAKKRSYERFGYYKQRSRENLRVRAGSIQSIQSISSIISQEAAHPFLSAPVLVNLQGAASSSSRSTPRDQQPQQLRRQYSWEASSIAQASSPDRSRSPSINPPSRAQMIPSHPHQWSSQLSTVMSESEGGSSRDHSPSVSSGNGHGRRGSAGWASSGGHSRQMQSISSSLAAQLEDAAASVVAGGPAGLVGAVPFAAGDSDTPTTTSSSIERPHAAHTRAGPSEIRIVRDQDEHGDGLADLRDMSQMPSRTGLSAFFASDTSGRNLHSSASTRSKASSVSSTIPTWARVYYGSGERRWLSAPSASTSDAGDSRPGSAALYSRGSPNPEHFSTSLYAPRRRPHHVNPPTDRRPFSDSASMEIAAAPQQDYGVFGTIKRKTSSIWSPHLRVDRRAPRYSMWEPPSVSWSIDSGLLGKRNVQVVLFILGFILPLAWMVAAVLPLPPNPKHELAEPTYEQSHDRFGRVKMAHQMQLVDESRYESAKWWRNLNRGMTVVGLFIMGAIVALVVVGSQQGWVLRADAPA